MWGKFYAAVFILGGLYLFYKTFSKSRRCSAETVGTVNGRDAQRKRSGGRRHRRTRISYYPIVEFEVNGQIIKGIADISSGNPDKYPDGTMLTVRYNPEDPQDFIIKNKSAVSLLIPAILMILLGVAFLFVKI
ncbi:MAG: DUF3592 domain-containing protein [Flexilinea sp.]|jgi:hypothetical protein|nr:DUF3592 domain-containing protein [Flexilinea sp.]